MKIPGNSDGGVEEERVSRKEGGVCGGGEWGVEST
jgi:hypothetical protein